MRYSVFSFRKDMQFWKKLISGHDRLHYWPFDVQKVRTSKGGWLPSERSFLKFNLIGIWLRCLWTLRCGELNAFSKAFHVTIWVKPLHCSKYWEDLGGLKRLRWRALGAAGRSIEMVFWLWVCIVSHDKEQKWVEFTMLHMNRIFWFPTWQRSKDHPVHCSVSSWTRTSKTADSSTGLLYIRSQKYYEVLRSCKQRKSAWCPTCTTRLVLLRRHVNVLYQYSKYQYSSVQ